MQPQTLLPDARRLQCGGIHEDGSVVTVMVASCAATAVCPKCGHVSRRVHSHYQRHLQDLPWQGIQVRLYWRSRRFFCDRAGCPQRIFTERLPEVAARYAHKTQRLVTTLRALALACGGEVGARLARRLEIPTSADTLLREIRRCSREPEACVRVLGVDDWAMRRGQRYGTILVDLEAHRAIDLLPDRSAESFAAWLVKHPEVEIIGRDRGEYYIRGASTGAPQATQVTDRWHLLHNLHEVLTRVLERFPKELSQTAHQAVTAQVEPVTPEPLPQPAIITRLPPIQLTGSEQRSRQRRARWVDKYQQVIELHQQKRSARAIARELSLDRGTVRRWLQAGCLPERVGRPRRSRIGAWSEYLESRWQAGCHNAVSLTTEIQAQGFTGSYYSVRRYLAPWRLRDPKAAPAGSRSTPSAKSVAWWLLKSPADRTVEQQRFVELLYGTCPIIQHAASLARDFAQLVRDRRLPAFKDWLLHATAPESSVEMQRFAKGLREDLAAVEAALRLPWSNGQTEGQVNRLKLIKRQMFGRAKFDLLRCRVLSRQI
jgi:transposase